MLLVLLDQLMQRSTLVEVDAGALARARSFLLAGGSGSLVPAVLALVFGVCVECLYPSRLVSGHAANCLVHVRRRLWLPLLSKLR